MSAEAVSLNGLLRWNAWWEKLMELSETRYCLQWSHMIIHTGQKYLMSSRPTWTNELICIFSINPNWSSSSLIHLFWCLVSMILIYPENVTAVYSTPACFKCINIHLVDATRLPHMSSLWHHSSSAFSSHTHHRWWAGCDHPRGSTAAAVYDPHWLLILGPLVLGLPVGLWRTGWAEFALDVNRAFPAGGCQPAHSEPAATTGRQAVTNKPRRRTWRSQTTNQMDKQSVQSPNV